MPSGNEISETGPCLRGEVARQSKDKPCSRERFLDIHRLLAIAEKQDGPATGRGPESCRAQPLRNKIDIAISLAAQDHLAVRPCGLNPEDRESPAG